MITHYRARVEFSMRTGGRAAPFCDFGADLDEALVVDVVVVRFDDLVIKRAFQFFFCSGIILGGGVLWKLTNGEWMTRF